MIAQRLAHPGPIQDAPLHAQELPTPDPAPERTPPPRLRLRRLPDGLQLCEGDLAARRLPVTPGHQIVGRVEALGPDVSGWRLGDRAGVAWLAGTCGRCRFCATGRENLCPDSRFTGWDRDGGFAELATVRADFALRLPDAFDDLAAAPLLCGGVIGYRALKRSSIAPGGRLGLYGFGASARLAIQVARHWGCEVFVSTRSQRQQERARRLGAVWAGGPTEMPPLKLDAAVSFAPVWEVVASALRALDRGGTLAVNAIHLDGLPQFPYADLWWERNLVSVANFTREDAQEFLDLAAAIPLRTEVEAHPLADANLALQRLAKGDVDGAAVLLPGS